MLDRLPARRAARARAERRTPEGRFRPRRSSNREIASRALVREPIRDGGGAELWITYNRGREEWLRLRDNPALAGIAEICDPDALNGYVAFPKRRAPRLPAGTGHLVQFIPVHGGVTYAVKDGYMAVWGFDTMHSKSQDEPRADRDWIRAHCLILYRGLVLAEKLYPEFKRATPQRRGAIADQLLALVWESPLPGKLGTEALINLLGGRIG